MLKNLHVKNLALIEDADIDFAGGLNILTGETGAGKSLLMGSVLMALGSRFDTQMIRNGAQSASVELVFDNISPKALEVLGELDIEPEDDGTVIIKRVCSQSKSSCRINGSNTTVKEMKKLSQALIDVHGQRDYENLLHRSDLLTILDSACGPKINDLLSDVSSKYKVMADLRSSLESENMDSGVQARQIQLSEYELKEIEEASLKEGEDEELENAYRRMSNFRKIAEGIEKVHDLLGGDGDENALSFVSSANGELSQIIRFDDELGKISDELSEAESLLSDISYSVSSYISRMEFDEEEFELTEKRLDLINKLKSKYGKTIPDILRYADEKREQLEKYSDFDAYISELKKKVKDAEDDYFKASLRLSMLRKKSAPVLSKELEKQLTELNFNGARLEIRLEDSAEGIRGCDSVDFYISTNPGEDLKPISDVASGGELSRIMLAVKTVLAGRENTGTLIFDEIDSGISGITAWKVAESLGRVSAHHQVICITHLPQIASMADHHFVIEKSSDDSSTTTNVRKIEGEASVEEIARLLGSDEKSESSLQNARDLKKRALESKK